MGVGVVAGGRWLRRQVVPSSVAWSTIAVGGCHEGSFDIDDEVPFLTEGAEVVFKDGMTERWRGFVDTIEDGSVTCIGPWDAASGVVSIDGAGIASVTPDVAVAAAFARGAITWRAPALSAVPAMDATGDPQPLTQLLETWALKAGVNVGVNGQNWLYADKPSMLPISWLVSPHAKARVGTVDDYVTHLWGDYLDSATGTWATVGPVVDANAAAWRRREHSADLSELGPMTAFNATATLSTMLAAGMARKSVTASLRLTDDQVTHVGGRPGVLPLMRSGQRMRLLGIHDGSTAHRRALYTDITIGQCGYAEDTPREVSVSPLGEPPRNLGDFFNQIAAA